MSKKNGIFNFQVRIDKKSKWGKKDVTFATWDNFIQVITNIAPKVIGKITKGNTLRIMLGEGDDSIYEKFSLYGSSKAINNTYALCSKHMSTDKEYFNQSSTPADADGEYFL